MENIATRVGEIMLDSLFKPNEIKTNELKMPLPINENDAVMISAIARGFGFHKNRLMSHADEIKSILNEMPSQFHRGTGDGWSFLNLVSDKHGVQWGEHIDAECLFALAAGLGLAKFTLPREMWDILPGSMPYVLIDTNGIQ